MSTTVCRRVLIVDDDPHVLRAYERRLKRRFDIETAMCSEEGVTAVNCLGPFAVVVSDMRMPREDGAHFLQRILAAAPDSARIMLTGNVDQQTAIDAVNVAQVFRFLNKPCDADILAEAIEQGIADYHQRTADRHALRDALNGVVALLDQLQTERYPAAHDHAQRVLRLASLLGEELDLPNEWELEAAAQLCNIGCLALSDHAVHPRGGDGAELPAHTPVVGARLLAHIPQLQGVAALVAAAAGPPGAAGLAGDVLGFAREVDALAEGNPHYWPVACVTLKREPLRWHPDVLAALERVLGTSRIRRRARVAVADLQPDMELLDDIVTTDGMMLVARGHLVTAALRHRLRTYASIHAIHEPIQVLLPPEPAEVEEAYAALAANH